MKTIFVGGSRRVSRLPAEARDRLDKLIGSGFDVLVGDANGADKAVQKHLMDSNYPKVTVYCSGGRCRNNLGNWPIHNVHSQKEKKGFQFYALKDREMAREADFGLLIWDGKSPGTVLNVLRLIAAGKEAELLKVPEKRAISFKTAADWTAFLEQCSPEFRRDLRERATSEEWRFCGAPRQASFLDSFDARPGLRESQPDQGQTRETLTADMNSALGSGDLRTVVDVLGELARARGMSQVAQDTGLARESLYRALSAGGNPEFATILKVLEALGLRLVVDKERAPRPD